MTRPSKPHPAVLDKTWISWLREYNYHGKMIVYQTTMHLPDPERPGLTLCLQAIPQIDREGVPSHLPPDNSLCPLCCAIACFTWDKP